MNNQEAIKTLRELRSETNDSWYEEVYDIAISTLQAQGKCEDAVSRTDMLETYADLYDIFEDNDQIRKELNKVYDKLNALSSVTPKLSKIDFLMPESELVFYDNDHGFCINTQDVLEHIRGYMR